MSMGIVFAANPLFFQSQISIFFYLCAHYHKQIDMKKLSFILFCLAFGLFANFYDSVLATVKEDQYQYKGLEMLINKPFLPQQYWVFRM